MEAEGSSEIPEEVAYAENHQRYLISRVSGCGVVRGSSRTAEQGSWQAARIGSVATAGTRMSRS
jgi:hypothetical protein